MASTAEPNIGKEFEPGHAQPDSVPAGVTRRDFLRALASGGMVAATGLGAGPVAAAQPRQGGNIRVASVSSSTADTLDPAKSALSTDYVRCFMFYSGLTQLDSSLAPQLSLAESIDPDRVATTWTIKLRKGVVFHDGKPLTPADVVYSLNRHKIPATGSKMKQVADQFVEVAASGPNEVRIRLAAPNADLPVILADPHFLIIRDGTTSFTTANGTGPYKVAEFTPGVRTVGVRNANFWKTGKPYLDEIELIGISDEAARVNALLSGDVQLINAVNPRSTKRIRKTGRHTVVETKSGLYTDLVMRVDSAPASNPDFALAMKYLFDRQQMVRAVFRNFAVVGNDQPIPPSHRYYFAGLPQRPYDPERAKFHLQKAGMTGATVPVFATPAAEGSVDLAVLLQLAAQQAGLNLRVQRVPGDGYWSNHWMKHPLTFGNINPRASADALFTQFFKSDAAWNESGWKNEQFDQLLIAARSEPDDAKRKQFYGDMQVLVHEKCGIAIPAFISLIDGYDSRLKGLASIPLGGLMGYMFSEFVWLDA